MMQQPRKSVVPRGVLERTAAFLCRGRGKADRRRAGPDPSGAELRGARWAAGPGVVEEAVCLGEAGMMAGVLSAPVRGEHARRSRRCCSSPPPRTSTSGRTGSGYGWPGRSRASGSRRFASTSTGVGDSLLLPGESPAHAYGPSRFPRFAR